MACPSCARPIAGAVRIAATRDEAPTPSSDPSINVADLAPLDAGALARRKRLLAAPNDGVVKLCAECGDDVSQDIFRTKTGRGYICSDCQDVELEITLESRERRKLWLWRVLVVFVVALSVLGTMAVVSMTTAPKAGTAPAKK